MTKPQLTPTQGILVAIDIGKTRNEVLIEIPGHARRRRLTVLNTRADYDRLIDLLSGLGQPVTCAFEATGNYHRPLARRLLQAGFTVRLISSLALARTREALHNGWDKNDPKDAQVALHMLRIGATQHYHDPLAAGLNDIQEVSKAHEAIAKAKTELLHLFAPRRFALCRAVLTVSERPAGAALGDGQHRPDVLDTGAPARGAGVSFPGGLVQDQRVECEVGHRLAQALVLDLQLLHALDLVRLEPAVLLAPAVVCDLGDPNRADRVRHRGSLRDQHVHLA